MDDLREQMKNVADMMDLLETERESVLSASRRIIRKTKRIIHSIHLNEKYDLTDLHNDVRDITGIIASSEFLTAADIQDAAMEYAEVCILSSVLNDGPIPSFSELKMDPRPWVLGLADCLGEMRRSILDMILRSDVENAKRMFKKMDGIYEELMLFDVPDAILPIRRKQDIARSIVERTRSDLAGLR